MKKYIFEIIMFVALIIFVATSCTENISVKRFGGTGTVALPAGERLINATWKQDDLWYITEPMPADYVPSNKTFQEKSNYGLINGKIIFVESR